MLIAEYSYEEDMQGKQEETKKEGMLLSAKIFQSVKKQAGAADEEIAQNVGCTVEEVQSTRKMFGL